ncbi:2-C-methyl-D-erythritol 4-phosphate cytidylyltransferase [Pseudorhodobacter aquimaris]|uniref:2-C-methyl-D-erythritol 4-phosphate cytidylyltransferase n=1 Tax=Pseudorhodobacter aquimaris TaxID=687412 RepID=UPI00067C5513|nr:2-C-methyl-D-erythritol 4-phosphate cytidylyltransferase [Pseudorhodobacter aquimaris]
MTSAVIITAAGRGLRAGGDLPKQWQMLGARPVLAYTVDAFRAFGFAHIIVTLHPDDMSRAACLGPNVDLVTGGENRAQSVRNALETLDPETVSTVFIHDGARPFVTSGLIARLQAALQNVPAAAPALPVTDALWRGDGGLVTGVQDRAHLFRAQTPQAFHLTPILAAHRAHPGNAADDVEVARAAGLAVAIVEGEEDNIKITLPGDFLRAEKILAQHQQEA